MSRSVALRRARPGTRDWVVLLMTLTLVLTWCVGWGRYTGSWASTPRLTPAGGTTIGVTGGRLRLMSLERGDTVVDEVTGPVTRPGEVFVVARFVFAMDPGATDTDCSLALVFDDATVLDKTEIVSRPDPFYCLPENGSPQYGEVVWPMPAARADHVVGVAHFGGRRGQGVLIRPPG